jgi:Rieske Fe-S protein
VDGLTRRQALDRAAQAGAVALLGGAAGACSGVANGKPFVPSGVQVAQLSTVRWVPVGSCFTASRGATVLPGAYLRRDPITGGIEAISAQCTHQACPVRYAADSGRFLCPCHGGVFDNDGKPIAGPPKQPLNRLQTAIRQNQVYLVGVTKTCK